MEYKVLEEKLNSIDIKVQHVEELVKDQREQVVRALDRVQELDLAFAGRYETCPNVRLVNKHEAELNRLSGVKTFLAWVIPVSISVASIIFGLIVYIIAG